MKPASHQFFFRALLSAWLICFGFLAQAQDSPTGNFTATNAEGPLNLRTTTSAVATNRLTILGAAGATAGFVGIGTTTPGDLLHVNGIARANQLNLVNGTLNTTAAATNMSFNINGTNRMTLLAASGNLGVGTATPSDLLHVNGIARANQLNLVNGTLHTVGATNLSLGTNGVTQMTLLAANGNLGIGTNTPGARIGFENVDGTSGTPGITWFNPTPLSYGIYRTAGTWTAPNYQQLKMAFATGIVLDPGVSYAKSFVDVQGNGLRVTSGNFNIGAAPINTTAKFQLNYTGTAAFTGAVIKNAGTSTASYAELTMYNNIDKFGQVFFTGSNYNVNTNIRANAIGIYSNGAGGMAFVTDDAAAPITFATANTHRMRIAPNGNVGIGTSNPNEKLTVNGIMYGREVKVDATVPGPDYVFEKDYDLMTLDEVKAYIDENKHLPEVPSAKEMETNGLKLGEMNMLLLKKIEELTLHLLAMEERMKAMQKKLDSAQQK